MSRLPRVLMIAANPFTWHNNSGVVFSSLFENWPYDRLSQINCPFVTPIEPMFDVCGRYWALGPLGLRRMPLPSAALQEADRSRLDRPSFARRGLLRVASIGAVRRRAQALREFVYARPGLVDDLAVSELSREAAPELIFTTLGSLFLLRVVLRLAGALDVPIVPYFTDDWISTEYQRVPGRRWLRPALERGVQQVLERAPVRLVSSQPMADEYARRYGGSFRFITRCLHPDRFAVSPRAALPGAPVELVYAGQLSLDRWRSLRTIGEQLQLLQREGLDARLSVYTLPQDVEIYRQRMTVGTVLRMAGFVPNDALPAVYDAADVLVHVESFDREVSAYTRYSLSTKLMEYLMAGRALLGFGPEDIASMTYVRDSGAGVVVSNPASAALREALRDLLIDHELRARLGLRARAFALAAHDSTTERRRFGQALAEASAG